MIKTPTAGAVCMTAEIFNLENKPAFAVLVDRLIQAAKQPASADSAPTCEATVGV